ncbi:MAG: hypothetical protein HC812_13590 [Leptolyngbya sp. RL_3_1]|nr:hypothetical protein [Leptolyngbya sp. RL_3_1]
MGQPGAWPSHRQRAGRPLWLRLRSLCLGIVLISLMAAPASAQFGLPLQDMLSFRLRPATMGEVIETACVRLDGHCIFRMAATPSDLYPRIETIEAQLIAVRNDYLDAPSPPLQVAVQFPEEAPEAPENAIAPGSQAPEIYVTVGDRPPTRLMSAHPL